MNGERVVLSGSSEYLGDHCSFGFCLDAVVCINLAPCTRWNGGYISLVMLLASYLGLKDDVWSYYFHWQAFGCHIDLFGYKLPQGKVLALGEANVDQLDKIDLDPMLLARMVHHKHICTCGVFGACN